jgi:Chromo (CHRromatin Organisation MOdifier) domain
MHLLGVKHGMTAAFHPSADGQAEKTNQTVEIGLWCFLGGKVDRYPKWMDYLPILEHEYNSLVHESTKYTPNELRFAIPLCGISDLATPPKISSESAESLADTLKNIRDDARDSMAIAQRKQKKYADQGRSPKEFQVGDLVLLKYTRFGPGYKPLQEHKHKLAPLATPIRIVERLSPVSYRLDLPPGSKIHDVVSVLHLRRYRGDGLDIHPEPVVVDEEEEWEVERIEGERIENGVVKYLIKWKGWGDPYRTWEPAANLEHAPDVVLQWRAQQKETGSAAAQSIKRRKLRPRK